MTAVNHFEDPAMTLQVADMYQHMADEMIVRWMNISD